MCGVGKSQVKKKQVTEGKENSVVVGVSVTPRFATVRGLRRTPQPCPSAPSRRRQNWHGNDEPKGRTAAHYTATAPPQRGPGTRDLAFAGTWAPCCRAAGYWPPVPPHVALPAGVAQSHDTPQPTVSLAHAVRPPARRRRATFSAIHGDRTAGSSCFPASLA